MQRLFNVNENGNMNLNDEFCERFVWMACDDDAFVGAESFDLKKAMDQRARMNNIRAQLTNIREEYEDTVVELNDVKKQGRESLKTRAKE